jgi:hypothetical protein
VDKQSIIARSVGDVSEVASSGGAHSAASSNNQEVLWLVLQESRYDAIASGRPRWEARPRDRKSPSNDDSRDPSFDWKLAKPGRLVILQRGMGTGAYSKHAGKLAVKIAQVRIISSAHHMLQVLAADLVPNNIDPTKFHKDLYGVFTCAHAFVAMRSKRSDEASM